MQTLIAKLIKIKEHFDLCNIWRLRNLDVNNLLSDKNMLLVHGDFFAALSTDHSPVTTSISRSKNRILGHGFWKFNSYLLSDQNYITKTKNLIQTFYSNQNFIPNAQLKWELLKYEIRKFTISYFQKNLQKNGKKIKHY